MKKIIFSITMMTSMILVAVVAEATMVTNWNYSLKGTFLDYANDFGGKLGITRVGSADAPGLRWGFNPYSSIYLYGTENSTGGLATNGDAVTALTMTHTNNAISSFAPTLNSGTIGITLGLTPYSPAGDTLPAFAAQFNFSFFETPNSGPNNLGQWDDIFVSTDRVHTMVQIFNYNNMEYAISFGADLMNLAEVSPYHYEYVREKLGITDDRPLYGWLTAENQVSNLFSNLTVKTPINAPVPEPGTMALMGLGMLVAGMFSRRMRNTA